MEERMWHLRLSFLPNGREMAVVDYINQTIIGIEAIASMRTHRKTVAAKVIEDKVQLLP